MATASNAPTRRFAVIYAKNVAAYGRPPTVRAFYADDAGDHWAVPREHEYRALQRQGERVEIEIRCFDDQFAYPVTR